jgi:hypothetical protein
MYRQHLQLRQYINPLNSELNPICNFLALLGANPILHVSGVRVNIYIAVNGITWNVLSITSL